MFWLSSGAVSLDLFVYQKLPSQQCYLSLATQQMLRVSMAVTDQLQMVAQVLRPAALPTVNLLEEVEEVQEAVPLWSAMRLSFAGAGRQTRMAS